MPLYKASRSFSIATMASLHITDDDGEHKLTDLLTSKRDLQTQATISVVLGLGAFLAFCVSRTRWFAQSGRKLTVLDS